MPQVAMSQAWESHEEKCLEWHSLANIPNKHGRIAIFAAYCESGKIPAYISYYLRKLREAVDGIIFVCDGYLAPEEAAKVRPYICHILCIRHREYDFGSYKRGIEIASKYNMLIKTEKLILCNNSVFGPIGDFTDILMRMESIPADFIGISDSYEQTHHVQSYFYLFRQQVISHPDFKKFFSRIHGAASYQEVVAGCELGLTKYLKELGFKPGALVDFRKVYPDACESGTFFDPTCRPAAHMSNGSPFLRRKAIFNAHTHNLDGVQRTLETLKARSFPLYEIVKSEIEERSKLVKEPEFSVIMPVWNRSATIKTAIDSLLSQTHKEFELIISDDGSTDDSYEIIRENYAGELESGRIKYIRNDENRGVSHARNLALAHAINEWIVYLDSDNELMPTFLEAYANAIMQHPDRKTFYSRVKYKQRDFELGQPFNYKLLLKTNNYIDMGSFVHHRSLYEELGGFDENLYRLVDYDLILKYTARYEPIYINVAYTIYNDTDLVRITNSVNLELPRRLIRHKHLGMPRITAVLLIKNEDNPSRRSLDSMTCQAGIFAHDQIIVDLDGSGGKEKLETAQLQAGHPAARAPVFSRLEFIDWLAGTSSDYVAFLKNGDTWRDPSMLEKEMSAILAGKGSHVKDDALSDGANGGKAGCVATVNFLRQQLSRGWDPAYLGMEIAKGAF